MPTNAPMLVDIRVLGVRFEPPGAEPVQAVKDLTIEIVAGEWTSLVGESGSGKSVTALSITGLLPPARRTGSIRWNGTGGPADLDRLSGAQLREFRGRRIAYIFQDPSSTFSPVERIGPQIARVRRAHFDESAAEAGKKTLAGLADAAFSDPDRIFASYPHELSGGMRQRAALAAALIAEPELLIADEPTTALDPITEAEILELLQRLRHARRLTVLFITHDLPMAVLVSDRIHVLRRGEKAETMVRTDGEFRPVVRYTKALLASAVGRTTPKAYLEVPRAL